MGKRKLRWLSHFQYKKGNKPHNKDCKGHDSDVQADKRPPVERLTCDTFQEMVTTTHNGGTMHIYDAEGRDSNMMILRPRGKRVQALDEYLSVGAGSPESDSYRLLHNKKTAELWNTAFKDHLDKIPTCTGSLDWDYSREQKRGLAWITSLRCSTCGYKSPPHKLYQEVSSPGPGRKAAGINVALSVGRMGTSLTTEGMRGMLLTANIHPTSASSMQDTANKVGQQISRVNRRSMRDIRTKLQEENQTCGLPANTTIRAEGDARYNNSMFSAVGKTPFQAGTQVTYTLCENVTKKKRVISVFCGNKLCKVGELMRSRGESVTCPGHDNCTANIPADENIGNEKRWAGQCLDELQQDSSPLSLSHLTTDGDSTATLGASTQQGKNIENLKDLRHFFESQRKQTCKAPFSDKMFPGGTKTARESVKKRFAQDLKIRCRTEYENAYQHFGGDIPKLIRAMSYSADSIVRCYSGDCGRLCRLHSFACRGLKKNRWSSSVLPKDFTVHMTESDETLLRECINLTLGKNNLCRIRFHTSTQKCESVNRAYLRSNSKCITYSRNFEPRIHRVIHDLNEGTGNSTIKLCEAVGAPVVKGSRAAHLLKQQESRKNYFKQRQSSKLYKSRRKYYRKLRYRLYDQKKENDYCKSVTDPKLPKRASAHCEHSYHKH